MRKYLQNSDESDTMSINSNWMPTRWEGCLLKSRDLGGTNSSDLEYMCSRENVGTYSSSCWAVSQWETSVRVEKELGYVWAAAFPVNYKEKNVSTKLRCLKNWKESEILMILWVSSIQKEEVTKSSRTGGSLNQHTTCFLKGLSSFSRAFPPHNERGYRHQSQILRVHSIKPTMCTKTCE